MKVSTINKKDWEFKMDIIGKEHGRTHYLNPHNIQSSQETKQTWWISEFQHFHFHFICKNPAPVHTKRNTNHKIIERLHKASTTERELQNLRPKAAKCWWANCGRERERDELRENKPEKGTSTAASDYSQIRRRHLEWRSRSWERKKSERESRD